MTDIPVTISLVGACGLRIDTSPGASPTAQLQVQFNLTQDSLRITNAANLTLTGLSTDDISIIGGIACQLANVSVGFVIDLLTDTLTSQIFSQFDGDLCRYCDSTIAPCP